jgi:hypothetical protein
LKRKNEILLKLLIFEKEKKVWQIMKMIDIWKQLWQIMKIIYIEK